MSKQNRNTKIIKKNKKNSTKQRSQHEFTLVVPRGISTIVPDRYVTTLRWWKSVAIDMSVESFKTTRFKPSDAFDPDPVVSTQPLGYAQLAAFYNSYRVLSSDAKAETVNTGDVPCTMVLFPSNTDPGSSPVGAYVTASRMQSYAKSVTGSLTGGPVSTLTNSMSTQKMFGSKMIQYDDNFSALVNTSPNNIWYWIVTHYCLAVSPAPFILNFFMDIRIEFFDRANLVQTST